MIEGFRICRNILMILVYLESTHLCCSFISIKLPVQIHSYYASNNFFIIARNFGETSSRHKWAKTHFSTILQATSSSLDLSAVREVDLILPDFVTVLHLCNQEFLNSESTLRERLDLNVKICRIFLPKLLHPRRQQHQLIGIKSDHGQGELLGFVDLSLQTNDGSLSPLSATTYVQREAAYTRTGLQPYLCNLLVSPIHRGRGLGLRLVRACEKRAGLWYGQGLKEPLCLHLHCETGGGGTEAPLRLYIRAGFKEASRISNGQGFVLFLRKIIRNYNSDGKESGSLIGDLGSEAPVTRQDEAIAVKPS